MKKVILIVLLICSSPEFFPQEIESIPQNKIERPLITNYGIVFTLIGNSSLYLEQNGKTLLLNSSPGCGIYYTLSGDKNTVGFKYIDQNGEQVPAIINLETKKTTYLHSPVESAGQISFVGNGSIAFTIGNNLIVISPSGKRKYNLGSYSNIAPISPDGRYVAYNNINDQIFILNLDTGIRQKITDDSCGYFSPQWSPDSKKLLYSSLAGSMNVYNISNGKTYNLGKGFSPAWSSDSRLIVFYRKEIKKLVVINSDIYISNYSGSMEKKLTSTPGQLESDPSFGDNDSQIVYTSAGSEKIIRAEFSPINFSLTNQKEISVNINPVKFSGFKSLEKVKDVDTLAVPYISQIYDVPDYFNGYAACAPTSAMMVLAFYKILPVWGTWCSKPFLHYSKWGRYISDAYRFRQINYDLKANDPNGNPAAGAYGFMWVGLSSPYSRMVNYFDFHGISASRTDAPSYETALNEVNAGRPYILCVGLTTAGHVVVAHGTASEAHTLIFNDPYGNKNKGYPNYYGRIVKYDWPGYNNGYQNLNTVYWSVAVKYNSPVVSDTIIDDLDFYNGFYLNNNSPASMFTWKDLNVGYNGHMWYSFTTDSSSSDSCYAIWTPNIPKEGYYEVSAFIPYSQAEAAKYKINTAQGLKTIIINQKQYDSAWAPLGKYKFEKGKSGYVRLDDESTIKGQAIIFDAVKWSYIDSIATEVSEKSKINPFKFVLEQNYPNPFNPTTSINYQIPKQGFVTLRIYNILGKKIKTLINEDQSAGRHTVIFNGNELANGVYFYSIRSGDFSAIRKMILLK